MSNPKRKSQTAELSISGHQVHLSFAQEQNPTIAQQIRVSLIDSYICITDQNDQYDAACKQLLSKKIILAWIMKSCLEEYRDCDVNEIAERYIEGEPQVGEVPVELDEISAPQDSRDQQ